MRRPISLVVAVTLMLVSTATAQAHPASPNACTKGDVQSLASGTMAIGKQRLRGIETGSSGAWACQFRLYDGNDDPDDPFEGPMVDNPEVPDVFTADSWFLGGIFEWLFNEELAAEGWDRKQGGAYLDSIVDRMFWREQGGAWTELPLTEITHRSVRHLSGEVIPVLHHRFHIFAAGSLAPGVYEWRWENYDPLSDPPDFTAYGEVHIVAN